MVKEEGAVQGGGERGVGVGGRMATRIKHSDDSAEGSFKKIFFTSLFFNINIKRVQKTLLTTKSLGD